jgi:hypothetical protein
MLDDYTIGKLNEALHKAANDACTALNLDNSGVFVVQNAIADALAPTLIELGLIHGVKEDIQLIDSQ